MSSSAVPTEAKELLNEVDLFLSGNPESGNNYLCDLVSQLSSRMVEFNKQRQREAKDFIELLENSLKVSFALEDSGIEASSKKKLLKSYVGDYRKDQAPMPFEDIWEMLQKNVTVSRKNLDPTCKVNIQREYEKGLSLLVPIKRQMALTDWLIDQLVYRLYRLTQRDIDLIEVQAKT